MSDNLARCTFAIISHPDAGKTTITEKLLLYGGAIQLAGTVKGRKAAKHATSDWMKLEKERGISVTTSVMQFPYHNRLMNLLDTPGHEDFSEDTYRTLTAVDSALMVIDAVKGVEARTIKLMEVCRLRDTPIITFINKLDRDSKPPMELLDEIERILNIRCVPITWPLGMGRHFKGIYHRTEDAFHLYQAGLGSTIQNAKRIVGFNNPELDALIQEIASEFREEWNLIQGATDTFNQEAFLQGKMTPVFFGSALNNFGVEELLSAFAELAPSPQPRETLTRIVEPEENKFSGFVFKIQANMDPKHRDRIAFVRVCSGAYTNGIKLKNIRTGKEVSISNALSFMAGERDKVLKALPGDIVGFHNYGNIQIGDTFTEGENLQFLGIPNFAPELFRSVRAKDPMKSKILQKGLSQLSEEGATQVFRPLLDNRIIMGAVGELQFDVVAHRLQYEYNVDCIYEPVNTVAARWVTAENPKKLDEFENKQKENLSLDAANKLTYLAPSNAHLRLTQERFPDIRFHTSREHLQ